MTNCQALPYILLIFALLYVLFIAVAYRMLNRFDNDIIKDTDQVIKDFGTKSEQ